MPDYCDWTSGGPNSCYDDYWNEAGFVILLFCAALPVKIVLFVVGVPGACCKGACGRSCCYKNQSDPTKCCDAKCWSGCNSIAALISLALDVLNLYFLITEDGDPGWWISFVFLCIPTLIHVKMYHSLNTIDRDQGQVFQGQQAFQMQQMQQPHPGQNMAIPIAQPLPVQAGPNYCHACGGMLCDLSWYWTFTLTLSLSLSLSL